MSLSHKLTILAFGTSWRATCSCERWKLDTWDRETIPGLWEQHLVWEGGL